MAVGILRLLLLYSVIWCSVEGVDGLFSVFMRGLVFCGCSFYMVVFRVRW